MLKQQDCDLYSFCVGMKNKLVNVASFVWAPSFVGILCSYLLHTVEASLLY